MQAAGCGGVSRGPSTAAAAAAAVAAAALQRRSFLEAALRCPSVHGYLDATSSATAPERSELVGVPNASYAAAASAAAVLSTQLAIQAWFRTALDSRTAPLPRLTDVTTSYTPAPYGSQTSPTSPLNDGCSTSPCLPVDDVNDSCTSQLDEASRPASESSHSDDQQLQSSSSVQT